jgi:RHS repeat-associated protein
MGGGCGLLPFCFIHLRLQQQHVDEGGCWDEHHDLRLVYDSFGKLTASTGSLVNPFQYSARESDTETGLYYYRARYYDPYGGRFFSEDPIRFASDNDFYIYVANNSVNRKDPFGRWQLTVAGGDGGGIVLTIGHNSGQWNAGTYFGIGASISASYDPTDSGCHSGGFHGGVRADAGIGSPTADNGSASGTISVDGNGDPDAADLNVSATAPGVGSIAWNPAKPHEAHGVLSMGLAVFAGLGATAYSSGCTCDKP